MAKVSSKLYIHIIQIIYKLYIIYNIYIYTYTYVINATKNHTVKVTLEFYENISLKICHFLERPNKTTFQIQIKISQTFSKLYKTLKQR